MTEIIKPTKTELLREPTGIAFLDDYLTSVRGPFNINNHVETIRYHCKSDFLLSRRQVLLQFLNGFYDESDDNFPERQWATHLTAEILLRDLIARIFEIPFGDRRIRTISTPSSIDQSVRTDNNYQKGADFMTAVEEENGTLTPVLAGDNTISYSSKAHKQESLGVHLAVAMPVIIVTTEGLTYGGGKPFLTYIENEGRERLINGIDDPFWELSASDADRWKGVIADEVQSGIQHCRDQFTSGHPLLEGYAYKDDLLDRLNIMQSCITEAGY